MTEAPPPRGIEAEIVHLIESSAILATSVDSLAERLTITRRVIRGLLTVSAALVVVVVTLVFVAVDARATSNDLGVVQADLRTVQCDAASLWLSLLDLPQPEPDPPLTPEEQAQADAALAEFTATYTAIYESLACAELER